MLLVGEADEGEQLVDPALDLGARSAPVDEAVSDVPADRQVREKRVGLEDDAEVALGGRRVGHVAPGQDDLALVLPVEPGDGAQERGLAAAGRTEKADELAAPDLEIDVLQGSEGAEALRQALDAEEWLRDLAHAFPYSVIPSGARPEPREPGTS